MIYVFLADGCEEIEAVAPVDIMRRAGLDVCTVGVTGKTVTGSHKVTVTADIEISELNITDAEMVVLPGGLPGTYNLEADDTVKSAVRYCYENGRYVAAICAAPSILAHMGLLDGRKATCAPGFAKELAKADYTGESVTVDGKIITGKGAGAALLFGYRIVEILVSEDEAAKHRASMQYV